MAQEKASEPHARQSVLDLELDPYDAEKVRRRGTVQADFHDGKGKHLKAGEEITAHPLNTTPDPITGEIYFEVFHNGNRHGLTIPGSYLDFEDIETYDQYRLDEKRAKYFKPGTRVQLIRGSITSTGEMYVREQIQGKILTPPSILIDKNPGKAGEILFVLIRFDYPVMKYRHGIETHVQKAKLAIRDLVIMKPN